MSLRTKVATITATGVTVGALSLGAALLQFVSPADGPIIHMDSAVVIGHRLYTAHSNYSQEPEESSIEVFDTKTTRHVGTRWASTAGR